MLLVGRISLYKTSIIYCCHMQTTRKDVKDVTLSMSEDKRGLRVV